MSKLAREEEISRAWGLVSKVILALAGVFTTLSHFGLSTVSSSPPFW